MVIAGLTGGIGTGKSTVAAMFQEAGAIVIDADKIAFDVVKKGKPAWKEIVSRFGEKVLGPDNEINRTLLGDIIFNNASEKEVLNKIVHPKVFEEMGKMITSIEKTTPDSIVILDVPLLIESGLNKMLPHNILVYIPQALQLKRLMDRDKTSKADAMSRIRSQMSIEEKKSFADIIIDNTGSLEETRPQVLKVFNGLKRQGR